MKNVRVALGTLAFALVATVAANFAPQHVSAATLPQIATTKIGPFTPMNNTLINTILNNQITLAIHVQEKDRATHTAQHQSTIW